MNTEQRVARLEALLERVRRNAALLRSERGISQPYDPFDEAEPVPLVRVTSAPPGRLLERFSDGPPQPSEAPVSGMTRAAEADDGEIVDVPADALESLPPSVPPPEVDVPLAELAQEPPPSAPIGAPAVEEPPASSQRSRVAATMDEALAAAAELEAEDGREVPIVTPPPESGPQEAPLPTGLAAPGAPDVEVFFESEPAPPLVDGHVGETIDFGEPSSGPALELDAPSAPEPAPVVEDLAVASASSAAEAIDTTLVPPAEARDTLEAPEAISAPGGHPPPVESGEVARADAAPDLGVAARSVSDGPEVYRASLPAGTSVAHVRAPEPAPRPATFLELLDASLALGSDD